MKRLTLLLIPLRLFMITAIASLFICFGIESTAAEMAPENGSGVIYFSGASRSVQPGPGAVYISGSVYPILPEAYAIFTITNEYRTAAGIAPLTWSDALADAAILRVQECRQVFSHMRPDGSPWWTLNAAIMYGENIAVNYFDAQTLVQVWMSSPQHKENILNPRYHTLGTALYKAENGYWYWAQEFGL